MGIAPIELRVNGVARRVQSDPARPLLYVLRDDLGLTGTKYGCGEGECGACTVLLDARATKSCRLAVSEAAGREITTIEGLAPADGAPGAPGAPAGSGLHPLQQAFIDAGAFQCGYCTSGMLMAAASLLRRNPHPTEAEIAAGMNGNVCRCGTYPRIVAAIRQVAGQSAAGGR
ncbi:MAG TPA: (2Fe-2S)-binding protein [Longimicrobiales bacterium]